MHKGDLAWEALTHNATWPSDHVRSREKLNTKNLLFCKVYGYQTWQGSDFWWEEFTHDVTWPSDNVVTWGHVTKWNLNISSSTRLMITKLCRVVNYDEGNSPIMPWNAHNTTLILKSCDIMWLTKSKTSPLLQCLWPPNLLG